MRGYALNNLSEDSLRSIIRSKTASLQYRFDTCFNADEKEKIAAVLSEMEAAPFQFICIELDQDIKTLFALIDEARILNMNYAVNTTQFQVMRAEIETLSCFKQEQRDIASFAQCYKQCIIGTAGTVLGYWLYKGISSPQGFLNPFKDKYALFDIAVISAAGYAMHYYNKTSKAQASKA